MSPPASSRLERREILFSQLIEPLGGGQVLEAMVTQVAKLHGRVEQLSRGFRNEHLPAVAGAHDPRRTVHVHPHIALVGERRLAGVHAHANPDAPGRESLLSIPCGRDRVAGAREGHEEGVALRIHLDPAVSREGVAQQATMLCEHFGIALAEVVEQARRALDVRKQQRHGPARKLRHEHMIVPRRNRDKSDLGQRGWPR
jgi:hypothetical protein